MYISLCHCTPPHLCRLIDLHDHDRQPVCTTHFDFSVGGLGVITDETLVAAGAPGDASVEDLRVSGEVGLCTVRPPDSSHFSL